MALINRGISRNSYQFRRIRMVGPAQQRHPREGGDLGEKIGVPVKSKHFLAWAPACAGVTDWRPIPAGNRGVIWLIACLFALVAQPAFAAAPLPANVQTMVTAAEKAYAAADFAGASDLFEQAWKAAPASTTLLYNAGRAAQLAKNLDRAEDLYQKYLALTGQEPKFLEKSKAYLLDVQQAKKAVRVEKAKAKAQVAEQFQNDKRYRDAAAAYRDAYRLDEANLEYLFKAGQTASIGGDDDAAKQYLTEYLAKAPADAAERADVERMLRGAAPKSRDAPKKDEVAERVAEKQPPPSGGSGRTVGLITAIGGLAVAGAGVALYATASVYGHNDSAGNLVVDRADAGQTVGPIVAAVGGAAAVAGVVIWLLSDSPKSVTVVPTWNGINIAWQF